MVRDGFLAQPASDVTVGRFRLESAMDDDGVASSLTRTRLVLLSEDSAKALFGGGLWTIGNWTRGPGRMAGIASTSDGGELDRLEMEVFAEAETMVDDPLILLVDLVRRGWVDGLVGVIGRGNAE